MSKSLDLPFDPIERAGELWEQRWGTSSAAQPMVVATSIMRVQQLLLARFDAIAVRHRLTFARYEALVLLAFSRTGKLPMSRIGERLMVHPTSVTNTIQRLAADGFVERVPDASDGRVSLAAITPEGVAAMESVTAELTRASFGLGSLDTSEVAMLFDVLRRVRIAAGDFSD